MDEKQKFEYLRRILNEGLKTDFSKSSNQELIQTFKEIFEKGFNDSRFEALRSKLDCNQLKNFPFEIRQILKKFCQTATFVISPQQSIEIFKNDLIPFLEDSTNQELYLTSNDILVGIYSALLKFSEIMDHVFVYQHPGQIPAELQVTPKTIKKLSNKNFLVFVLGANIHWKLVLIDTRFDKLYLFDSGQTSKEELERISKQFEPYYFKVYQRQLFNLQVPTKKQTDGVNCGMYVINYFYECMRQFHRDVKYELSLAIFENFGIDQFAIHRSLMKQIIQNLFPDERPAPIFQSPTKKTRPNSNAASSIPENVVIEEQVVEMTDNPVENVVIEEPVNRFSVEQNEETVQPLLSTENVTPLLELKNESSPFECLTNFHIGPYRFEQYLMQTTSNEPLVESFGVPQDMDVEPPNETPNETPIEIPNEIPNEPVDQPKTIHNPYYQQKDWTEWFEAYFILYQTNKYPYLKDEKWTKKESDQAQIFLNDTFLPWLKTQLTNIEITRMIQKLPK